MTNVDHNTRPTCDLPNRASDRVSFDVSNWKFHSERGEEPTKESYRRRIQGVLGSGWDDVSDRNRTKGELPKRTS